jgi:hypothetical protein
VGDDYDDLGYGLWVSGSNGLGMVWYSVIYGSMGCEFGWMYSSEGRGHCVCVCVNEGIDPNRGREQSMGGERERSKVCLCVCDERAERENIHPSL